MPLRWNVVVPCGTDVQRQPDGKADSPPDVVVEPIMMTDTQSDVTPIVSDDRDQSLHDAESVTSRPLSELQVERDEQAEVGQWSYSYFSNVVNLKYVIVVQKLYINAFAVYKKILICSI